MLTYPSYSNHVQSSFHQLTSAIFKYGKIVNGRGYKYTDYSCRGKNFVFCIVKQNIETRTFIQS